MKKIFIILAIIGNLGVAQAQDGRQELESIAAELDIVQSRLEHASHRMEVPELREVLRDLEDAHVKLEMLLR